MRDHSWDVRMYMCTFVSVMLGMSICTLRDSGIKDITRGCRWRTELGKEGNDKKKRDLSHQQKSQCLKLFKTVYLIMVLKSMECLCLDIHILCSAKIIMLHIRPVT